VVDRGLKPLSGQAKDYKIGICCFSAKHTALRSKSKNWLARNQNNMSEWSDMSICELLFQWLDLQLPMQSVPITTNIVSSNPAHGGVYSIHHYVIKSVNDLRQVGCFLRVLYFPPPIKLTATM
jgi:hypothetical protein